jgi:large-conductance mechanosensitive channel
VTAVILGSTFGQIVNLLWSAIWTAFLAIVLAVTYHDLRVAKEGVDTEQIAAVFE